MKNNRRLVEVILLSGERVRAGFIDKSAALAFVRQVNDAMCGVPVATPKGPVPCFTHALMNDPVGPTGVGAPEMHGTIRSERIDACFLVPLEGENDDA